MSSQNVQINGEDKTAKGNTDVMSSPPVIRRIALFADGMARAVILPFGPSLVYRLVYGDTDALSSSWSGVSYFLAVVVAAYISGRLIGSSLAARLSVSKKKLPIYVARLGGAILTLHIFTYGAGLESVKWLVVIRFMSAILAGIISGITNSILLPEDEIDYNGLSQSEDEPSEAMHRRGAYMDISSGTAKVFLTGFAISILSGGLLFRKATKDSTLQSWTGTSRYSLSPFFLLIVSVTTEVVLRGAFSLAREPEVVEDAGTAGRVRGLVRRIVSDKKRPATPTVVTSPIPFNSTFEDERTQLSGVPEGLRPRGRFSSTDLLSVRSRLESQASLDEFFDCRSVSSDVEVTVQSVPLENESNVAVYVNGECRYQDGTPAYVPQGDSVESIPPNYLQFHGNSDRAHQAWEKTQQWRQEKQVWKIHTMPNRWFPKIKEAYPHFVHGHSKAGYPIVYEQPGRMNLKQLFRSGCKIEDMVRHYTFFMEFLSNRVCTRNDLRVKQDANPPPHNSSSWGIMVVMDVKGAGLSHLSGDVVMYLKQAGDINSAHYPQSMKRAFLVNSPFWLAGAWSGIKGILPDSVQVDILSDKKYLNAMREFIDDDQIPPEYGGSSPYALGEHPYEVELRDLVREADGDSDEETPEPRLVSSDSLEHTVNVEHEKENASLKLAPTTPLRSVQFTSLSPLRTPPGSHPIRRRVSSVDRVRRPLLSRTELYTAEKDESTDSRRRIFVFVTTILGIWSAVQGTLELVFPMWILTPTSCGGLGYSPSRSGVTMFCASVVLLWILSRKSARTVSQIPNRFPLRAFRIGTGAESVLLFLLATYSASVPSATRSDSISVMATSVLVFACSALANMLGLSATNVLHRIAAESYAQQSCWDPIAGSTTASTLASLYGGASNKFQDDCRSGKLTTLLTTASQMLGVLLAAPLYAWSLSSSEQSYLWDGTLVLYVASGLTFCLYLSSFRLHMNPAGEFATSPRDDTCRDVSRIPGRRLVPFVGTVLATAVGDVTSLLTGSSTGTGSRVALRGRTGSEVSGRMERGEVPASARKGR